MGIGGLSKSVLISLVRCHKSFPVRRSVTTGLLGRCCEGGLGSRLNLAWRRGTHSSATAGQQSQTEHVKPKLSAGDDDLISQQLVNHLERTSLVDFESQEAISRLNEAITFANQLFEVDTEGVEPLVTVLEDESLYLRDDTLEPTKRKDILKNASVTEEDYFVAPPGNIPLEPKTKTF